MARESSLYNDEDDKTSTWDMLGLTGLIAYSAYLELVRFLATHPTPVGIINNVNVVFGYWQNIPAYKEGIILKLRRTIWETLEVLTCTQ